MIRLNHGAVKSLLTPILQVRGVYLTKSFYDEENLHYISGAFFSDKGM
jgi:hypothetical protein